MENNITPFMWSTRTLYLKSKSFDKSEIIGILAFCIRIDPILSSSIDILNTFFRFLLGYTFCRVYFNFCIDCASFIQNECPIYLAPSELWAISDCYFDRHDFAPLKYIKRYPLMDFCVVSSHPLHVRRAFTTRHFRINILFLMALYHLDNGKYASCYP